MFGANAFAWPYFGQAYAGVTTSFVDGPFLVLRVGRPTTGWAAYTPRTSWNAGLPA